MKKLISIVTPTYNEEENIQLLCDSVRKIMSSYENYDYEHIFIDNASEDKTVEILKEIAKKDKNVKIIINTRNFGHMRSPYHALLQTKGDAVIALSADFQEPPELIPKFIEKWEQGFKIAIGVRTNNPNKFIMSLIKRSYYNIINRISEVKLIKNFTGFGLYDKKVVEILKEFDDPYPYFRGLVCDIGFKIAEIPYEQKAREKGVTKNNLYTLYDTAMLGITNHSKVPLRIATIFGFIASVISFLIGLVYLVYKLINWKGFELGIAPLVIGLFFFFSLNLFFLGILGEYVGSIHTQVLKRPLVIEKERVNFN